MQAPAWDRFKFLSLVPMQLKFFLLACFWVAQGGRWAIARFAIGEPKEASFASLALTTDHVVSALALATELFALEAERPGKVTLTRQGAVVEIGCQRENGISAETWRK